MPRDVSEVSLRTRQTTACGYVCSCIFILIRVSRAKEMMSFCKKEDIFVGSMVSVGKASANKEQIILPLAQVTVDR